MWNPVKELKEYDDDLRDSPLCDQWNPVKELKDPGFLVMPNSPTNVWNPVKELKAPPPYISSASKDDHVESGEGIESFHVGPQRQAADQRCGIR